MQINIIDIENLREIQEQLFFDVKNIGFNADNIWLEFLKEAFCLVEEDSLEIK